MESWYSTNVPERLLRCRSNIPLLHETWNIQEIWLAERFRFEFYYENTKIFHLGNIGGVGGAYETSPFNDRNMPFHLGWTLCEGEYANAPLMNLTYSLCGKWLTKGLLCCRFPFFSSQVRVLQSQITALFRANYIEQVHHYPVVNIIHVYLPPSFSQARFKPRVLHRVEDKRRAGVKGETDMKPTWGDRDVFPIYYLEIATN